MSYADLPTHIGQQKEVSARLHMSWTIRYVQACTHCSCDTGLALKTSPMSCAHHLVVITFFLSSSLFMTSQRWTLSTSIVCSQHIALLASHVAFVQQSWLVQISQLSSIMEFLHQPCPINNDKEILSISCPHHLFPVYNTNSN